MRKTFQKWLLLFVASASVITFCLSFYIQTQQAKNNAIDLVRLKIADAKRQLLNASENVETMRAITNAVAISKARALAAILVRDTALIQDRNRFRALAEILDVDELHIVNAAGIIVASNTNIVGYDMKSAAQSRAFMPAARDPKFELAQTPQSRGIDGKLFQYAGVARLDEPGIVQIGFHPRRLEQALQIADLRNFAPGFRIGNNGLLLVVRNGKIVSSEDAAQIGQSVAAYGILPEQLETEEPFQVFIGGTEYLGIAEKYGNYQIVGLLPSDEMYLSRNAMIWFLVFCNLVIFGVVFVLVTELVQRVVISGIQKVNRSLTQITAGKLDEKVNVRTNTEFISLSDGINTTVNALKKAIADTAARIDAELEFARSIQQSAMPRLFPPFPERHDFDIFAVMETAREVGGDFYDFFLISENRLAVVIADVSGKGIPAALFMMTAKTTIKNLAASGRPPARVLAEANDYLCQDNETNMFVTVFLGVLDLADGQFEYANAGHNPPLLSRADGPFEKFPLAHSLVLGAIPGIKYNAETIQLNPGDRLLLYTDGVTEAQNAAGELYGEKRLLRMLNPAAIRTLDATGLLEHIQSALRQFENGAPHADDVTMLALKYSGAARAAGSCRELNIAAKIENLARVLDFINHELESTNCSPREAMQINLAVEEIFTNIANYAYNPEVGEASVRCTISRDPLEITIQFTDAGVPYNPLDRDDPDTTLPAEDRDIGGLGILMVKKSMDQIHYEYKNHRNVLTLQKNLKPGASPEPSAHQ